LDPVLHLLVRAGLAVLFVSAATHKLADVSAFRASLAAYELVPGPVGRILSVLIPACEVTVAVALLLAGSSPLPSLAAAGLLFVYTAAIAINLLRGRRDIDCGCGGPTRRQPLGVGLVARNTVLLSAAIVSALPAASRQWIWIDGLTLVGGLAVSFLLYQAVEVLLAGAVPVTRHHRPADEQVLSFEVRNA
jgi:hypothetical protein